MKAISFYFSTLLVVLLGSASFAQQKNFTIKGTITGLTDKSIIAITDPDNPSDTLAKSFSKANKFELKGSVPDVKLYHINFLPSGKKGLLFLQNATMELTGDLNAIQQLKLSGSVPHDDFMVFQQQFEPHFKNYAQLSETASRTGVTDSLMFLYQQLLTRLRSEAASFSDQRNDREIAPFMWATIMQVVESPELVEASFDKFTPRIKSSFYGRFLEARITESKIGRIGTSALEFIQADTSGKPIALSSFRGKYVLIDFWASWCGPCRHENPNVVQAHNKFKSKNFTVLGVSLDNNKDKWMKAIEDDRLAWTQLSDLKHWQNEVAQQYRVQSIPQNLLIDPNGIIIAKNLRGQELQTKLCELLGCDN